MTSASSIVIGIYPATDYREVDASLQALYEHAPTMHTVLLLADDHAGAQAARQRYPGILVAAAGGSPAAAFNCMTAALTADIYIFLEAGACCTHGALPALLAALHADPAHGLAGPSTNRAWNEQASAPAAALTGGGIEQRAAAPAPLPLVSCIMPTRGRPAYVARAISYFLGQDYANRELLIAYEQEGDIAPRVDHPAIRYLPTAAGMSIGARRNEAVRQAHGELIAQWDDDDWYASTRLSRQLAPILANAADITGLTDIMFLHLPAQQYWRVSRELFRRMFSENVCGGTLVYRRALWQQAGHYPATSLREDAEFLAAALRHGARLCRLNGRELFTYVRHDMNTWKFPEGRFLRPEGRHAESAPAWMEADHAFYAALALPLPLVSCIMPTANRPAFVPKAIAHFLRQDYAHKELIIIDDGVHPIADLVPTHPALHYLRLPHRASIGAKRNLACERANGELIVHWDDDDWMAPDWISSQVRTLRHSGADLCGLDRVLFYAPALRQAWQYVYDGTAPWVCGATMCYRRELWQRNRFPDIDVGEDNAFVWSSCIKHIALNDNAHGFIATIHEGNTSPKDTANRRWHRLPAQDVERLLQAPQAA